MSTESAHDKRADSLLGKVLASRYLIESKIGEGAMGSVYKARHIKVGRPFAVKILHRKLLEDQKIARRFDREAELAGRLRHPNVVGVVDVGETPDGLRYMVMDFAEGADLAELLAEAPMTPERIVHLTRQMLEGLYHAHEAGLIHRDLKPENIIVEQDDHGTEVPRIVDFGISILRDGGDSADSEGRLTTNGLVLGTPHYMAPEQAVADPIDHRIDLFAMGIIVYEMLCGKLPFDGNGAEVARSNLLLDPPPISRRVPYLEVDPLLEAFAQRLMAKKRDARPATAATARVLLDLIDRDREAAAEALGVALHVVVSASVTAPVGVPRLPAAETEPPPLSGPIAMPVDSSGPVRRASLEVTPIPRARTGPTPPVGKQSRVPTKRAEPLPWGAEESERRSSRRWIIAALFGAVAAGAIVAISLGMRDRHKPPATKVVMHASAEQPPAPVAPTPPTASDVVHASAVEPAQPGSADATPGSAVAAKESTRPKARVRGNKMTKPIPTRVATAEGSAPSPEVPELPPESNGNTAADVERKWRNVEASITKLKKSPLTETAGDQLYMRWRRIRLYEAMATEKSRNAALAELAELQRLVRASQP